MVLGIIVIILIIIFYIYFTKDIKGGSYENIVVHISGASGSGKTTLGNKLKEKFKSKIVMKDLDDLRQDFIKYKGYKGIIKEFDSIGYQSYIDNFISKQKKPIIFVGLNVMHWWHKDLYYNLNANHKFYIKLDNTKIFKQKCSRFIDDVFVENKNLTINNLINNENKIIKNIYDGITHECGFKETTKMNDKWIIDYKKQGYKFMSSNKIYEEVIKIVDCISGDE